jgi:hypothetical protein
VSRVFPPHHPVVSRLHIVYRTVLVSFVSCYIVT